MIQPFMIQPFMTQPFSLSLLALQTGTGSFGTLGPFLFQIGAIMLIVYFLIIRPPQKQRQKHEARLNELKKGDHVVTVGGIVGEIVSLKEGSKDGTPVRAIDDHITIKTADTTRIVVERGRIAKILGTEGASSSEAPQR